MFKTYCYVVTGPDDNQSAITISAEEHCVRNKEDISPFDPNFDI